MKQTAVEFLLSKTSKQCFNKREIEQALQMEKEQQDKKKIVIDESLVIKTKSKLIKQTL
jgi:hypothetical protein